MDEREEPEGWPDPGIEQDPGIPGRDSTRYETPSEPAGASGDSVAYPGSASGRPGASAIGDREIWRHRTSGRLFLVELDAQGRAIRCEGPLAEEDTTGPALDWTVPSQGRTPAFTEAATWAEDHRDEFDCVRSRSTPPVETAGRPRAVDCVCGEMLYGRDDEQLVIALRVHLQDAHGEPTPSEADVRRRVRERAYEPPSGDPPWAY